MASLQTVSSVQRVRRARDRDLVRDRGMADAQALTTNQQEQTT